MTRDADPSFPARGTLFHHTFAFGPIDIRDETAVVESDAPRRLGLHGRNEEALRRLAELAEGRRVEPRTSSNVGADAGGGAAGPAVGPGS